MSESVGIAGMFISGGPIGMSLITILFAALFFAAWKAPAWVKELGISALIVGVLWTLGSIYQMLGVLQQSAIDSYIVAGGAKCTIIPMMYGLVVYLASLVIRIIQKPRI